MNMQQATADKLMRFAASHDSVTMMCFDGEAITIGCVAIDTNLPEGDECREIDEFERVTSLTELRNVLGY